MYANLLYMQIRFCRFRQFLTETETRWGKKNAILTFLFNCPWGLEAFLCANVYTLFSFVIKWKHKTRSVLIIFHRLFNFCLIMPKSLSSSYSLMLWSKKVFIFICVAFEFSIWCQENFSFISFSIKGKKRKIDRAFQAEKFFCDENEWKESFA